MFVIIKSFNKIEEVKEFNLLNKLIKNYNISFIAFCLLQTSFIFIEIINLLNIYIIF
jgi:hypothetical protein